MATDQILALLLRERNKIAKAIEALQSPKRKGRPPLPSVEQDSHPPVTVDPTSPAKRKMSAAGRRVIIAGTKKRWAAIRAAKAAAAAPALVAAAPKKAPAKAPAPIKKGGLTAAGRKALSIAMKKRWAKKKAAGKRETS